MGVAVAVRIDPLDVDDRAGRAGAVRGVRRTLGSRRRRGERRERQRQEGAQSRIAGNSSTSRRLFAPVSSITRRSMPRPTPPVGGMPASSAWM
jgi:hypothetical protein